MFVETGPRIAVLPTLVFLHNGQNFKKEGMSQNKLLYNTVFAATVSEFDKGFGLRFGESLNIDRQTASLVWSVAAHEALIDALSKEIGEASDPTGRLYFRRSFVGHSMGEMGSLTQAMAANGEKEKRNAKRVMDKQNVAKLLEIRQSILEQSIINQGLRQMFVAIGVDPDIVEHYVQLAIAPTQGKIRAFRANINTPTQVVYAVEIMEGTIEDARDLLKDAFPAELAPKWRALKHISNDGYHTKLMCVKEGLFIPAIKPLLTDATVRHPQPYTVYSPMLQRWLGNRGQIIEATNKQLTNNVDFCQAMIDTYEFPGFVAYVSADTSGIMPKLVEDNVGSSVASFNIHDPDSFEQTLEGVIKILPH